MDRIIITIGRQIGSGGRDIAKWLAREFNCKFYDKEILNLAAKESGFKEKFFEQNDEKKEFFLSVAHFRNPFSHLTIITIMHSRPRNSINFKAMPF